MKGHGCLKLVLAILIGMAFVLWLPDECPSPGQTRPHIARANRGPAPPALAAGATASPATTPVSAATPVPTPTGTPVAPTVMPTLTPIPLIETVLIATSAQGRSITAQRIGRGEAAVVVVGAIHGDQEANTGVLVGELAAYFVQMAASLPQDVSLYLVPVFNPDGFGSGSRLNGHGVDLNRNWATDDWRSDAYQPDVGDYQEVGGISPFSEPETRGLSTWLLGLRQSSNPLAIVFYHSGGAEGQGLVIPGSRSVGGQPQVDAGTAELAATFARQVGYAYSAMWEEYEVTGAATDWCAEIGLPAIDVELPDYDELDAAAFARHVSAVMQIVESRGPFG
jgi:hypothetical protein